MGLTHENLLYACTDRELSMWNLNHFINLFGLSRGSLREMSLFSADNKTTRLMTLGEDSW